MRNRAECATDSLDFSTRVVITKRLYEDYACTYSTPTDDSHQEHGKTLFREPLLRYNSRKNTMSTAVSCLLVESLTHIQYNSDVLVIMYPLSKRITLIRLCNSE